MSSASEYLRNVFQSKPSCLFVLGAEEVWQTNLWSQSGAILIFKGSLSLFPSPCGRVWNWNTYNNNHWAFQASTSPILCWNIWGFFPPLFCAGGVWCNFGGRIQQWNGKWRSYGAWSLTWSGCTSGHHGLQPQPLWWSQLTWSWWEVTLYPLCNGFVVKHFPYAQVQRAFQGLPYRT